MMKSLYVSKLFKVFGVMLSASFLLCGCHGSMGSKEFELQNEFDESRNYEITFWAKNDTNKNQTDVYEKAIADFESIYPNINVNMRLYTDYGRIYNDVITNIATHTTPNVCITYPDHIATYLTSDNLVVPLDELLINEEYGLGGNKVKFDAPVKDEIVSQYLEECRFMEHYYALPYMRSTECCYVNKTFVEKLGFELPDVLTWDFVWKVSDAAAKQDKDGTYFLNGQKVMIPFIYKSTDNMMIQALKQKNAGYSDPDGNILLFNDTTKELLEDVANHTKSGAFSTFKISSYPANYLNAGQCVFAIDSTAGSTWMGSKAPLCDISKDKIVDFETEVRTIPQYDVNNPKMISQGPSICLFNKGDSQEVMASWLFMQYLLTNDIQIGYAQTEGYSPVTSKARETDEYQKYLNSAGVDNNKYYDIKIKATKILIDNTDNTFVTPVFNGSTSLRDAAGQLIENTVKSVRRKQTVDSEYYDKLYTDVTALYRLDQMSGQGSVAGGRKDLGPLPVTAKILLYSLVIVWICLLSAVIMQYIMQKKRQ